MENQVNQEPLLQSQCKYYTGLTVFQYKKVVLRWEQDGFIRVFDIGQETPVELFSVTPAQIGSARVEVAQLVLVIQDKTYRFETTSAFTLPAVFVFGVAGAAYAQNKVANSDANTWIQRLQAAGVQVGNTDTTVPFKQAARATVIIGIVLTIVVVLYLAFIWIAEFA